MLTGNLSDILRTIISDYSKLEIDQLLQTGLNALGIKGSNNLPSYPRLVADVRNRAANITQNENALLRSSSVARLFESSDFVRLLPRDIAAAVVAMTPDDINMSASTAELSFLRGRVHNAMANFNAFLSVTRAFRVDKFELPTNDIVFSMSFPSHIFDDNIGELGANLKKFDDFFGDIAEYGIGEHKRPKLAYASTSILTFLLHIDGQTAIVYLKVLKSCFDTAKSAISFRNSLAEMKKNGLNEDSLKAVRDPFETQLNISLENAIKTSLRADSATPGSPRANEIESRLLSNCKFVTRKLEAGVEISLERVTTQTASILIGSESRVSAQEAAQLLLEFDKSQKQLSTELVRESQVLIGRDTT